MKHILLLSLVLFACGADDGGYGDGNVNGNGNAGQRLCAQRTGTVRMNLTARSGNCGASYEDVATASSQPNSLPAPCTGTLTTSSDNCDVTEDATCPNSDGTKTRLVGKVNWDTAGTHGSGIMALTLTSSSSSVICQGTYDVVYTKL